MSKKNLKYQEVLETSKIFRRSLIYQTKEFFQNSTLHGVRYIAESGRPIGEKFMWFCFTSIGAVTALVIIMSLWEKFQTNPTITGLDTDFHNQNVIFPTTVVCPETSFNHDTAYDVTYKRMANYDHEMANASFSLLEQLTSLNFVNLNEAYLLSQSLSPDVLNQKSLREWAFEARISCEESLGQCKYRDEAIQCCSHFDTVYTEHGMCFAFNSRFKSLPEADVKTATLHDLYETDKRWGLFFVPNTTSKIIIFANEEYLSSDFGPQLEWHEGQLTELRITKKNTYTTDDARQLTIGQRKCIFSDEVKLQFFPEEYTVSACLKNCRMKKAIKLCKCNPPFYKPVSTVTMCTADDLPCLDDYKDNITNIFDCLHCELSCTKTVYNIEKLNKQYDQGDAQGVLIEFLTWPIIRYKREVLFGWVDLLVSFGGIASLFLGFSLLSGVEIIYYFTLRACCMVYKNRQELYEIEEEIAKKPPPHIDFSLKPKWHVDNSTINVKHDDETCNNLNYSMQKSIPLDKQYSFPLNVPAKCNAIVGRRRKTEKELLAYSKSLYNSPKVTPQYIEAWQPGQYLP